MFLRGVLSEIRPFQKKDRCLQLITSAHEILLQFRTPLEVALSPFGLRHAPLWVLFSFQGFRSRVPGSAPFYYPWHPTNHPLIALYEVKSAFAEVVAFTLPTDPRISPRARVTTATFFFSNETRIARINPTSLYHKIEGVQIDLSLSPLFPLYERIPHPTTRLATQRWMEGPKPSPFSTDLAVAR